MWARKRIDISAKELIVAMGICLKSEPRESCIQQIVDQIPATSRDSVQVCLSVRSGFDLALTAADWPTNSEIIFSGYTIPDMPQIAQAHGLIPVPVDIDWETLAPTANAIKSALTPRTKAIVIAHLFGGRCDLGPISEITKKHGLLLIEDCAQSYLGNQFTGSSEADISMFSFGPIKTNTALGGAIVFVRNHQQLVNSMNRVHKQWPTQTRKDYAKRILKYSLLKFITCWPVAASIRTGFRWFGSNHDQFASNLAHSFDGKNLLPRIRKQPTTPLLHVLARRLGSFEHQSLSRRRQLGNRLAKLLDSQFEGKMTAKLPHLGMQMNDSTYWVFAVLVEDPKKLVQSLWNQGYDATSHSSLQPVSISNPNRQREYQQQPSEALQTSLPEIDDIHRNIVFVPLDIAMSESEIDRLGAAILGSRPQFPHSLRYSKIPRTAVNLSPTDVSLT